MVKLLYRITAFVMAVVMLFGCISCKSNNEQRDEVPEYDKNQRFELINDPPSYSEEFIERAAISFADIGERLALAVKNVKVTEAQKISFKNYFKTEIFSILVMAQIYSDEADALFSAVLEYLDGADGQQTAFEIFANIYRVASKNTDARRVGIIAFELSKLMIGEKAEDSRKRYEKYGYPWYLEDAERYESLESDLSEKLGRDKFIKVSDIFFFVLSSVYGIGMPENELGLSVNEREAAAILEMQADHFCEAGISVDDWRVFGGILTELVQENNTSHINAELYALKKNGYFVSAIEVMPSVLALYEAVTNKLYDNGVPLYSEAGAINLKGILSTVLESDAELTAFLDKLESCAATDTKAESDAVASLKLAESYGSFIGEYTALTREEFISELRNLIETDCTGEQLYLSFISYAVGFAPYLAFTVHNQK